MGKKLLDICKNHQVYIFNGRLGEDCSIGKPTTTHNTTIDYFIGSPMIMKKVEVFKVLDYDPLLSDVHCGLHARIKYKVQSTVPTVNRVALESRQLNVRPSKWNVEKQCLYVSNIDEIKINELIAKLEELSIDVINLYLKQILIEPALATFPSYKKRTYIKKSNNATSVGYDKECWISRKEYHKARQRYHLHRSSPNFNNMIEKSRKYKANLKRVKTKKRDNLIKELRKCRSDDPKAYWKILNSQRRNCQVPITLNELYEHFKQLACDESYDDSNVNITYDQDSVDAEILSALNDPISEEEVVKGIKKLKNNKSPASDMILNEYIKSTKHLLCPLYVKMFNKILDTGVMPSEWSVGTIVPLYKNKGDIQDVSNYRGITLLSCMGKLFTSILNERLNEYSNKLSHINETQAGFRHGYSTLDHVFLLKCVIDLFNWKKRKLFCLFVDYKKAFDMVWREGLWYKLVKEKVQGKILNVIRNMYNNIRSCVMLNQETSDTFVCNVGVRQGENLSPLLFAFYVNDIESKLIAYNCSYINFGDDFLNLYLKLFVIMYADDTVILCDSEDSMKQALVALNLYCNEWKLKLNCNKTKVYISF